MEKVFRATIGSVPIEADLEEGTLSFFGIPSALFWLDPSLYRMLSPLVQEAGSELARLLIALESSRGTKEDYEFMVQKLGPTFSEGFLAWGKAVGVAGWGHFELPSFEPEPGTAVVRVKNAWELRSQANATFRWGCPFLLGKLIGIFTHALGRSCWADERIVDANLATSASGHTVEFSIYPSDATIQGEIDRLREKAQAARQAELAQLETQLREKQRTILQMAMPAVQLWDGILLLPLVGEIDSHRASMLMDSALSAITKHAARVVIIDITGVPFVYSHVASSLIRTVQAARLLGVESLLVGISAEVARSLVLLGIDLQYVQTFSTLESGLKYALAKLNYKLLRRETESQAESALPKPQRRV